MEEEKNVDVQEQLAIASDTVLLVYYDNGRRVEIGTAEVKGDIFTGKIDPTFEGDQIVKAITRGAIKGLSFDGCYADEAAQFSRPDIIEITGHIPGLFGTSMQIPSVKTESCGVDLTPQPWPETD